MSRRLPMIVLSLALLAAGVGCDDQALSTQQSRAMLDQATQLITRSDIRYIPDDQPQDQPWSAYRAKLLQEASTQLDQIIAEGLPSDQSVARQLKAQIIRSLARAHNDQAMADFRNLSRRTAAVVEQLAGINTTGLHAQTLDYSTESAVEKLQAEITQLQQRQAALNTRHDELTAEINGANGKVTVLKQQLLKQQQEVDQLNQQAFVATGQAKHELEDKAAQGQLTAGDIETYMAQWSLEAQTASGQQALVQSELQAIEANISTLRETIAQFNEQSDNRQQARNQSLAASATSATKLIASVNTLLDQFQTQVDQPMDETAAQFDEAAKLFGQARSGAEPHMRETLELGELSARIDQVQAMTSHVVALGDMARLVRFISTAGLGLTDAQKAELNQSFTRLQQRQTDVMNVLTIGEEAAFTQAMQMAQNAPEDQSRPSVSTLQSYQTMADQAKLQ